MPRMGVGYSSLRTRMRRDVIEIKSEQTQTLRRILSIPSPALDEWVPLQIYRTLFPALLRSQQLDPIKAYLPEIYDEKSPVKCSVQVAGSSRILGDLPVDGTIHRESVTEFLSDSLTRRSKQIRLLQKDRYLSDSFCFLMETVELHYRVKCASAPPALIESSAIPNLFDQRQVVDECSLFEYMTLLATRDRASIDYPYATKQLKYPGLLIPPDCLGMILLTMLKRSKPDVVVKSYKHRVYGQFYTQQSVRLCGGMTIANQVVLWAELDGKLIYKAIVGFKA